MYNVLATGSLGNAVIYHKNIMIDCGVTYVKVKPFVKYLHLILLTHKHKDHFNLTTIKKIAFERPSIRFACGNFLADKLEGIKNVDIMESGKLYDYGYFQISPIKLYHDVENYGYRIFNNGHKIIHATDTTHLQGVEAKGYDLYAIEHNYNEDTINESIAKIESVGGFAYQKAAINSHLSEQQARDFIYKNRGENSKVLRLHESNNN